MPNNVNCTAIPASHAAALYGYSAARLQLNLGIGITQYILAVVLFLTYLWGICVYSTMGPTDVGTGYTLLPCVARSILVSIIVPVLGSVILLKVFCFYFTSKLYETLLVVQRGKGKGDVASPAYPNPHTLAKSVAPNSVTSVTDDEHSIITTTEVTTMSNVTVNVANLYRVIRTDIQGHGDTVPTDSRIAAFRLITSWQILIICLVILCLPFFFVVGFGVILPDQSGVYVGGCNGCFLTTIETANVAVAAAISLILLSIVLYRTKTIADPWGLRKESVWMSYATLFALMGYLLDSFTDFDPQNGSYDHQLLVAIGMTLFQFIPTAMQVWISWRTEFKEVDDVVQRMSHPRDSSIELGGGGGGGGERGGAGEGTPVTLTLTEILADRALLTVFEQFLSLELGIEALMFITDVKAWKRAFPDVAITARLARARRIFRNYVSPLGLYSTNLPHRMVEDIKNAVMKDDNGLTVNVFDTAVTEIQNLLNVGAVQRFKKSKLYAEFMGVVPQDKKSGGGGGKSTTATSRNKRGERGAPVPNKKQSSVVVSYLSVGALGSE